LMLIDRLQLSSHCSGSADVRLLRGFVAPAKQNDQNFASGRKINAISFAFPDAQFTHSLANRLASPGFPRLRRLMRTSILALARLSLRLFIHLSNKTVLRTSIIFECSSQAAVWVWVQHFCDCSGSDSSASEDGL